jgi:hypothetical protein
MMRMMSSTWRAICTLGLIGACGGAPRHPSTQVEIGLEPAIALQQWYRSQSTCAQGPYEIDLPVSGARWGEQLELRLHTPRRVAINAVIVADGAEVERTAAVFDGGGQVQGKPDNARCIADAHERLTLGRTGTGGGGTPGTPGTTGTPGRLVVPPPDQPTVTAQLDLDTSLVTSSVEVLRFRLPERAAVGGTLPRIRVKFWSIEPNDLAGVLFGVARIEWRPNVSEADYEAHLARVAAAEEARRLRRAEQLRREEEAWRKRQATAPQATPRPTVTVEIDAAAELAADRKREEQRRRRAVEIALEAERRARRTELCARHPEDRDCWGAGGLKVHLDLEAHQRERDAYCAANREDARCWSSGEWARRRVAWDRRVQVARGPKCQPDGPPPAALAETTPPKLSLHADWRPGYYQWSECTWIWLAGMWRVPEADIVAEQTTTAPAAPPAAQVEVAPVAPIHAAVWIAGFWQWSGTSWVWIRGSWQLRPEASATWRVPEWRPRGAVHVLIPGGWVRVGGRR